MIQQMLAIWSLVPLHFLNPACTSGSSQFTYYWSLAWRILNITLLACDGNPLQYSWLEDPMDGGAWWAVVHGVAGSRTWLSDFTFTFHFHFSLSCIGEGNGNPLQCSYLDSPRDGGAWWAAVYGVSQSWTQLKWLSSMWNESGCGVVWTFFGIAFL